MSDRGATERRWNWINGWVTAALHTSIAQLNLSVSASLAINDFVCKYSATVRNALDDLGLNDGPHVSCAELDYVFHMERELWGVDWDHFARFFPAHDETEGLLQTFHFVLSFYIIERGLKLLLPESERYQVGRKGLRRRIFGYQDGLLIVQIPGALDAMGFPFCLLANTETVAPRDGASEMWNKLKQTQVHNDLVNFYEKTTGKHHFCDIIEAALIAARRRHLPKAVKTGKQGRLPSHTRAVWYDVLWHYSESLRYKPLVVTLQAKQKPFYWNRSIRWFTSLAITGLLLIAQARGAPVGSAWRSYAELPLGNALGGSNRFKEAP